MLSFVKLNKRLKIFFHLFVLQMLSSCFILYVMKYFKIISFRTDKSKSEHDSLLTLVSPRRLVQTIPLAFTYLLYMVCVDFSCTLWSWNYHKNSFHSTGFITANYDGICTQYQCTNVHYSSTHNYTFYNDHGIFSFWSKAFCFSHLQVL